MKEFIKYVQTLQSLQAIQNENPSLENAIRIRDTNEIVSYLAELLLEEIQEKEQNQFQEIFLN